MEFCERTYYQNDLLYFRTQQYDNNCWNQEASGQKMIQNDLVTRFTPEGISKILHSISLMYRSRIKDTKHKSIVFDHNAL